MLHTLFSFTYLSLSLSCPHPLPPFLSVRSPCWLAHSRSQPAIRQLLLLRLESVVVSLVSGAHLDPHWLQPTHSPGTIIQLYVVCRYVWELLRGVRFHSGSLCVFSLSRLTHCHMDKTNHLTRLTHCHMDKTNHLTIFCTWDISLDLLVTLV